MPVSDEGRPVGLLNLYTFSDWQAVTPTARRAVQVVALRLGHVLERDLLGLALEARDLETAGHTERVVRLAERLGDVLGLPTGTRHALRGRYLHDIGKAVPDPILLKPGSLDADEWAVTRGHSVRDFTIYNVYDALTSALQAGLVAGRSARRDRRAARAIVRPRAWSRRF